MNNETWHHEAHSKSIEKYGDGSKKNPPKGWTFDSVWLAESVAKELNALEDRARLADRYAEDLAEIQRLVLANLCDGDLAEAILRHTGHEPSLRAAGALNPEQQDTTEGE